MGLYLKKGNWYIDYYVQGRRKREKIGTSKTLAENVLRKRKVEIAENKHLDIRREYKIKFEDFANDYLELYAKPNNKSWAKSDVPNIKTLNKFFTGKYLYEITSEDAERFKSERIKEVSASRVNRNLTTLKAMFNKAVEWGKLEKNPIAKVKKFREDNRRLRYLEKEEITRLLSNCSSRLKPIVVVALCTGMRLGEILGLKWHDIDFQRGIIHLLNTKNGEKREIPMNNMVKINLMKVVKHPDSPYVFNYNNGKQIRDVRTSFFTTLKKSGIINFRFHDLRHTFASQLVMSGVDLNTVRELLGHKSLEMTIRYSHLSQDFKKRAVDVLNGQIDTFWTPEIKEETLGKQDSVISASNLTSYNVCRGGGTGIRVGLKNRWP